MSITEGTHALLETDVTSWDLEADVVIVGYGCAGASAAIGATEVGADVIVLDRSGGWGGASAMAGGEIYMGGGTPIQQACGFEDTPEEMYKFLVAATGPDPDLAKLALYCERSVEHFNWLVQCGVPFKPSFYAAPCWEPPTDDGLVYSGGENAYPFNEIARPAPRGHVPQMSDKRSGERSAGWMLMKHLTATAEQNQTQIAYNMLSQRLVVASDGTVVGVEATEFGTRKLVHARRGVVLAAGGFVYNDEMLARHAPHFVGRNKVGTDTDDGRGIRMGLSVGAAVRHMDAGQTSIGVDPQLLFRSLLLNTHGHRFINEDTYPGRVGQTALFKQGGQTFMLYDDEINETMKAVAGYAPTATWVTEDLGELEREMGVPEGVLVATVEMYNKHAENGQDPVCHKAAKWLKPLRPPYGMIDMRQGSYAVFTTGGLSTTVDGEVRHIDGEEILGLYAAGRTSSGIPAWGYLSGTSLADGTFFGRRAGRAAGSRIG